MTTDDEQTLESAIEAIGDLIDIRMSHQMLIRNGQNPKEVEQAKRRLLFLLRRLLKVH
jgi:hypothetical protein